MSQNLQTSSLADLILPILAKAKPTERVELARRLKIELFKDSLFSFAKFGLGYKQVNLHTHSDCVAVLESNAKRKLIVMPRGTFKTSLASVAYAMWELERNPNLRILLDSELYTNSKNILREIKSHYESDRFVSVFGPRRGALWNEGEIVLSTRTEIKKEASITAGGVGTQKTGQHYDLIIADDLNSNKNSHTPEGCEKVIMHYKLYTSLLEPDGTIALVGTRYSQGDAINFVLTNELGIDEKGFGNS